MFPEQPPPLREAIASAFPPGYWHPFLAQFGHDFFEVHFPRTAEYDLLLGERLAGKKILEVGGFPGLLAAWYLSLGCDLTTIESPEWFPDWYKTWAQGKGIACHVHDIVSGAPALEGRWDVVSVSDVLIHMDGMPLGFLSWAAAHGDRILLAHYPWTHPGLDYDANPGAARTGTLRRSWRLPCADELRAIMKRFGMELEEKLATSDREILLFARA
jgi:hypothetical protein